MPPRFYCALPLSALPPATLLSLDNVAAQHVRVLRLAVGESITIFNGVEDGESGAVIRVLDKRDVQVEIIHWQPISRESPLDITLVQSLATGDKMDLIVQKAVELGVTRIQAIRSARSTVKLEVERAEKRAAHWQAIAIAACEQCGRNIVPHVATQIVPIKSFIETRHLAGCLGLFHPETPVDIGTSHLHLERATPFTHWLRKNAAQPLTVMVGPEGGFSDAEVDLARAAGATIVSLGTRVLRTETAGLAALAIAQAATGDLG